MEFFIIIIHLLFVVITAVDTIDTVAVNLTDVDAIHLALLGRLT